MKIEMEKHPGPFMGPDTEFARAVAAAVVEWYGDDTEQALERIRVGQIWNDHIAVQAALATVHNIKKRIGPELLAKLLVEQIGQDHVDNLGDGESLYIMKENAAINVVEMSEKIYAAMVEG